MPSFRTPAVAAIALLASSVLFADTVTLRNGDRLTGSVQRLADGTLVFQSELAGTVTIPWEDVEALEAPATFSVLIHTGERLDGQVSRDGARTSVTPAEGDPRVVPSSAVSRVARGGRQSGMRRLVRALDGSADVGYSVARGNQSQTQSSASASAEYTSAEYAFSGRLNSLFARQDDSRSQSRHALTARLDRYLSGRSFSYARAGLERNERRRLDLRARGGGGIGINLRRGRRTSLSLLGGLDFVHEHLRLQTNRSKVESRLGMEWSTMLLGVARLESEVSVNPNLLDWGHVRLEYDGTLRIPIGGRFTYSLSLFNRFDTRPAETVARNDYGLVSGFGLLF